MGTFLRLLFIASAIFVAYLMIRHPRAIRQAGRKARTVAYVYVAAVVISALFRLSPWGW